MDSESEERAMRIGMIVVAGLAAGLTLAGIGYLVYRRMQKPSLTERVRRVLPDALTDLPDEIRRRIPAKSITRIG